MLEDEFDLGRSGWSATAWLCAIALFFGILVAAMGGEAGFSDVWAVPLFAALLIPGVALAIARRRRLASMVTAWVAALGVCSVTAVISLVSLLLATPSEDFDLSGFIGIVMLGMMGMPAYAAFVTTLVLPFTLRRQAAGEDGSPSPAASPPLPLPSASPTVAPHRVEVRGVDFSGGEGSKFVSILNERLARGEITLVEYRELRHALSEA